MKKVRRSQERGHANHGWLNSFHTFSFADYHDEKHMGFRSLRVINEDRVAAGQGFGTHGHRDMEILSYVLRGELAHKDSMGNGSTLRPGDIQRMTAGTGVRHSEFNGSSSELVHFLQIWIMPEKQGLIPSYEERHIPATERRGVLRKVASRSGDGGAVVVHQDLTLWVGNFQGDESSVFTVDAARYVWVHLASGELTVTTSEGEDRLHAGDAIGFSDVTEFHLMEGVDAEVLLFDLA
jgi:hypothetical protein